MNTEVYGSGEHQAGRFKVEDVMYGGSGSLAGNEVVLNQSADG